jgi:hypothetical protein
MTESLIITVQKPVFHYETRILLRDCVLCSCFENVTLSPVMWVDTVLGTGVETLNYLFLCIQNEFLFIYYLF